MVLAQIEEVADAPLETILQDLHGWPVVDSSWKEDDYPGIEATMGLMRGLNNAPVVVRMLVATDDKNSSHRVIQVIAAAMRVAPSFVKRDDLTIECYIKLSGSTGLYCMFVVSISFRFIKNDVMN